MKRSCPDYNTLCEVLSPLVTEAWKPQLNNLALFVYGLLLAGHVHLPKIALTLPVTGNTRNALQRLERFLKNKAIQPTLWYEGVAKAVLARWKGGEIELIMDQTDLDDRFPLLFVALAFRKRAIPILWRLLPHEGCSGVEEQTKLFKDNLERYSRRFWTLRDVPRLQRTGLPSRKDASAEWQTRGSSPALRLHRLHLDPVSGSATGRRGQTRRD